VFDFDGTLARESNNETTWEKIWLLLGYSIDDCIFLHRRYSKKEISHEEWCDITKDRFRDKNLSEEQMGSIAKSIKLIPGTNETLHELHKRGITLHILSGSIKLIIREVIDDLVWLFDDIKANDFIFDDLGKLEAIRGTLYDFHDKATYLRKLISENRVSPLEVLFIGNSNNDEWASQSGARTLCVNPTQTNPNDSDNWTYVIKKMDNLNQILEYIP
jgi:HAD superfamily phosphoserine phosphatase-like hydrolase